MVYTAEVTRLLLLFHAPTCAIGQLAWTYESSYVSTTEHLGRDLHSGKHALAGKGCSPMKEQVDCPAWWGLCRLGVVWHSAVQVPAN